MTEPTPRQSSRQVGGRPRRYLTVEPPPAVLAMLEAIAEADDVPISQLTEHAIRHALFDLLASRGMPAIVSEAKPWPSR